MELALLAAVPKWNPRFKMKHGPFILPTVSIGSFTGNLRD